MRQRSAPAHPPPSLSRSFARCAKLLARCRRKVSGTATSVTEAPIHTLITAVALLLSMTVPVFASEPDATLYELTENMSITRGHRVATSALGGFAKPNTPLCPLELAPADGERCVINATGSNDISRFTGRGPITGTFTNVSQDANPIDIDEVVRRSGTFRGQMNLSDSSVTFLGTMRGFMTVDGRTRRFVGVVRFPVPCDTGLCYVTSDADAVPTGLAPLLPHEFALGRATVRLDIYFQ